MVGMKLFVEGGGDSNDLRTACRAGFAAFLKKAGLTGAPKEQCPMNDLFDGQSVATGGSIDCWSSRTKQVGVQGFSLAQ
jgi:hypothetical protein